MLSKVFSASIIGISAYEVVVEVESRLGIPHHTILGLPDAAVRESRQRIESAIKNSGFDFPSNQKLTINLAPADIRKEGPMFDLPMALGALASFSGFDPEPLAESLIIGELTLEGKIRPIKGVLAVYELALKQGFKKLILPWDNRLELMPTNSATPLNIYPVKTLTEALHALSGTHPPPAPEYPKLLPSSSPFDFSQVKAQSYAKRALEIAAAGFHNVLMVGSPGCGKTMLAKRLPGILPDLTLEEAFEVQKIYSICGLLKNRNVQHSERPFRSPHHTISTAGIAGGGRLPSPGEITLAHRGVLFLDEIAEFDRRVLEVLRQPLEDGELLISRSLQTAKFPSQFLLIAAMNPCPCGFHGHPHRNCKCHPNQIRDYWRKLSGPLLDRIDLKIELPSLNKKDLLEVSPAESSDQIKQRVLKACKKQAERFKNTPYIFNRDLDAQGVTRFCRLDAECGKLMAKAIDQLHLSGRSHERVLKISRTLADLDASTEIHVPHLSEALQYRQMQMGETNPI